MSASSKKKLRKEQNAAQMTEKQLKEKKEAKKLKTYTVTFIVIMAVILAVAIGTVSVTSYLNSGIRERNTVALTVGDHSLTNAELNYYYIDAIQDTYSDWYEQYGDYTDMYIAWGFGLDVTVPMNEQYYDKDTTFAQYFTDLAIEDVKSMYAIYDEAITKGHTLTDEEAADLDETVDSMKTFAQLNGMSFKKYLKQVYGNGAEEETFVNYLTVLSTVKSYQQHYHDTLTYDDAAMDAYNEENFNKFSSFSYSTFFVDADTFITGGTKAEDGTTTYSDEEKAAALKAAEEAAQTIVASGADTTIALDTSIKEHDKYKDNSNAKSSESDNSLYTDLNENIAEWLADDERQVGDLGYVPYTTVTYDADGNEIETLEGYYVVLLRGRNDNNMNLVNVRHILIKPTGGTTDNSGNTTYTEEEWNAAYAKAEAIRDEWLEGDATEDSFAALATEKTEDTGSKSTGGLYEDVTPGSMVAEFDSWIFDAERKAGDYDIVKTEYGYHVMYFVGTGELTYREHMIEQSMREEDYEAWYNGLVDSKAVTVINTSLVEEDLILANG